MRTPNERPRRLWVRDPFLFGMALACISLITIALAMTGWLFGDPALIGLAVVSVAPAFWLFYQRDRVLANSGVNDRRRRR